MIITPKKDYGMLNAEFEGDLFKFTHGQDIEQTLAEVAELKANQIAGGWSAGRGKRHVARIPLIEVLRHPEWNHDPRLIVKWLETDEGRRYVTNKPYTGKSAQCIVK